MEVVVGIALIGSMAAILLLVLGRDVASTSVKDKSRQ